MVQVDRQQAASKPGTAPAASPSLLEPDSASRTTTFGDWLVLKKIEKEGGSKVGKEAVKIVHVSEMLARIKAGQ